MNFFKKREQEKPQKITVSTGLPRQGVALPESLKAHSQFIKRVNCSQCGALLSFPVSANHVICPYCSTDTRRV